MTTTATPKLHVEKHWQRPYRWLNNGWQRRFRFTTASTIPHSVQSGRFTFARFQNFSGHLFRGWLLPYNSNVTGMPVFSSGYVDWRQDACISWVMRSTNHFCEFCASGIVACAAASPNCGECSRLKLRDDGSPALRTPACTWMECQIWVLQLEKVQTSHTLMARSVLWNLFFALGGHGHLEQPTNSMAWLEQFIKFCAWWTFLLVLTTVLALGLHLPCYEITRFHLQTPSIYPRANSGVRAADGSFMSRATALWCVGCPVALPGRYCLFWEGL